MKAKLFLKVILSLLILSFLQSCKTSTSVITNNTIQKRKYNDGFFISHKAKKSKENHSLEQVGFREEPIMAIESKETEDFIVSSENVKPEAENNTVEDFTYYDTHDLETLEAFADNGQSSIFTESSQSIPVELESSSYLLNNLEEKFNSPGPPKKGKKVSKQKRAVKAFIFGFLSEIPFAGIGFSIVAIRNASLALKGGGLNNRDTFFAIIGLIGGISGLIYNTILIAYICFILVMVL